MLSPPDSPSGNYDANARKIASSQDSVEQLLTSTQMLLSALDGWSTGKSDRQLVVNAHNRLLSCLAEEAQRKFVTEDDPSMSSNSNVVAQIAQELEEAMAEWLEEEDDDDDESYIPAIRDILLELLHVLRRREQQGSKAPEPPPRSAKRKSAGKTLFLQFGKRVRKVHCTSGLHSLDDVRVLFEEKFNKPDMLLGRNIVVYIRHPVTQSTHRLTDMQDVVNGSLLVLPIDTSGLRTFVEQQLHALKRAVQQQKEKEECVNIQSDVHQLREDINALQRISTEFRAQYQYMLANSIDKIRSTRPPPSLEQHECNLANVAARFCQLQDAVDGITQDIVQRRCRPSDAWMRSCAMELQELQVDLAKYTADTAHYRAQWRKNWERGLQKVASEQHFLRQSEALVSDVRDDCNEIDQVLEYLDRICTSQSTSPS